MQKSYNNYITSISQNIRILLDRYSMSILELSKKSGVSYTPLHSITLGQSKPTFETLYKIATAFEINIVQLLGEDPIQTNSLKGDTQDLLLLHWDNYLSNQEKTVIDKIKISCPIKLSDKAFALKYQDGTIFPKNTILIFETPERVLDQYIGQILC